MLNEVCVLLSLQGLSLHLLRWAESSDLLLIRLRGGGADLVLSLKPAGPELAGSLVLLADLPEKVLNLLEELEPPLLWPPQPCPGSP